MRSTFGDTWSSWSIRLAWAAASSGSSLGLAISAPCFHGADAVVGVGPPLARDAQQDPLLAVPSDGGAGAVGGAGGVPAGAGSGVGDAGQRGVRVGEAQGGERDHGAVVVGRGPEDGESGVVLGVVVEGGRGEGVGGRDEVFDVRVV